MTDGDRLTQKSLNSRSTGHQAEEEALTDMINESRTSEIATRSVAEVRFADTAGWLGWSARYYPAGGRNDS